MKFNDFDSFAMAKWLGMRGLLHGVIAEDPTQMD